MFPINIVCVIMLGVSELAILRNLFSYGKQRNLSWNHTLTKESLAVTDVDCGTRHTGPVSKPDQV